MSFDANEVGMRSWGSEKEGNGILDERGRAMTLSSGGARVGQRAKLVKEPKGHFSTKLWKFRNSVSSSTLSQFGAGPQEDGKSEAMLPLGR